MASPLQQAQAAFLQAQANLLQAQADQLNGGRRKPPRQPPLQPQPQQFIPQQVGIQWFGNGMGALGNPVVFAQRQAVQIVVPQQQVQDLFVYVDGAPIKAKGGMLMHLGHTLTLSPGVLYCLDCNCRVHI